MSPILKEHLISAAQTFVATFLTVLGTSILALGHIEWTGSFWGALILLAVRAALKEAWARVASQSLGGRKK